MISEKAARISLFDCLRQSDERHAERLSDRIREKCIARLNLETEIYTLTKELAGVLDQARNMAKAIEIEQGKPS